MFIGHADKQKKRTSKPKAHFPSNDTNFQEGAFIFETIFLRFCKKVGLMINSWNAFSKFQKKKNNIFPAFFAFFFRNNIGFSVQIGPVYYVG